MADKLTPEMRSWNMSRIRGKDTKYEVKVRKYLFSKGFWFRKNNKRYPGKLDAVLPKYKTVIFVNGCFWHMHDNCKCFVWPKSNAEFWHSKLEQNVTNDRLHHQQLHYMGWNVMVLWECKLKRDFESVMGMVINSLKENMRGKQSLMQ